MLNRDYYTKLINKLLHNKRNGNGWRLKLVNGHLNSSFPVKQFLSIATQTANQIDLKLDECIPRGPPNVRLISCSAAFSVFRGPWLAEHFLHVFGQTNHQIAFVLRRSIWRHAPSCRGKLYIIYDLPRKTLHM